MNIRDQVIVLFVFFPILTTITVGLRIFVRTRVNRGSFGYDDVALVITYVCWSPSSTSMNRPLYARSSRRPATRRNQCSLQMLRHGNR